jgi:hypothetical protein
MAAPLVPGLHRETQMAQRPKIWTQLQPLIVHHRPFPGGPGFPRRADRGGERQQLHWHQVRAGKLRQLNVQKFGQQLQPFIVHHQLLPGGPGFPHRQVQIEARGGFPHTVYGGLGQAGMTMPRHVI